MSVTEDKGRPLSAPFVLADADADGAEERATRPPAGGMEPDAPAGIAPNACSAPCVIWAKSLLTATVADASREEAGAAALLGNMLISDWMMSETSAPSC